MRNLIVGADIGQAIDPTAIVLAESYRPEQIYVDSIPDAEMLVRWIERVPLGTSYSEVVDRIARVGEAAQVYGNVTTVLDATGVGRPVVEMLKRRSSIPLRAVTFSAGSVVTKTDPYSYVVPKRDLVTALEVLLQGRRIHVTPDLALAQDMRAELMAFEVGVSARGHDAYEAASGHHDDLVMALALCAWWAGQPSSGQTFLDYWRLGSVLRCPRRPDGHLWGDGRCVACNLVRNVRPQSIHEIQEVSSQ